MKKKLSTTACYPAAWFVHSNENHALAGTKHKQNKYELRTYHLDSCQVKVEKVLTSYLAFISLCQKFRSWRFNSRGWLSNLIIQTKTNQCPITVQIQVHMTGYLENSVKFNMALDGRTRLRCYRRELVIVA